MQDSDKQKKPDQAEVESNNSAPQSDEIQAPDASSIANTEPPVEAATAAEQSEASSSEQTKDLTDVSSATPHEVSDNSPDPTEKLAGTDKASSDQSVKTQPVSSSASSNTAKESTKGTQSTAQSHASSTSSGGLTGWLLGLWLLVAIALGGAGYWLWMNVQTLEKELDSLKNIQSQLKFNVKDHDQGVEQLASTQSESINVLTQLTADQQQQQKQLIYLSEEMASLTGVRRQDWEIARLEYLLRVASQRLQLDGDLEGARSTLLAADEYLTLLDDPRLVAVRKQVAKDLLALKQATRVDRAGAYVALDALIAQVPALQPDRPQFETQPVEVASADSMGFIDWISKKLQGLVRITANEVKPQASWLSEDAKAQFNAMLTLRLLHAQQALMSAEQVVYDSALAQARELVDTLYLGRKDTQAFTEQLSELQGRRITMTDIDISGSHQVLKAYLEETQQAIRQQMMRSMIQGKDDPSSTGDSSGNKVKGN